MKVRIDHERCQGHGRCYDLSPGLFGDDEAPVGVRNEIITGPVSDWATDFSHLEPEWAADPYRIQDDLRQRCPIAHTARFGGAWLPTRYEDVAAIAYDTERFSSRSIILSNFRPPRELALEVWLKRIGEFSLADPPAVTWAAGQIRVRSRRS